MRYSLMAVLAALLVSTAFAAPPEPEPIPLPLPPPPSATPKPIPLKTPESPKPSVLPIPLKAPKTIEQPTPEEAVAIAKLMREMALQHMPAPLVKANDGWGKQKEYAVGRVMLRKPNRVSPELPRAMFNDGLGRRFTVSAREPDKTLDIGITELVRPEADKMLDTINVAMDINFRMEQQLWKRGLELYSGETRGHCKTAVQLKA